MWALKWKDTVEILCHPLMQHRYVWFSWDRKRKDPKQKIHSLTHSTSIYRHTCRHCTGNWAAFMKISWLFFKGSKESGIGGFLFRYSQYSQTTKHSKFPRLQVVTCRMAKPVAFLSWWYFSEVILRVDYTPLTSNPKLNHRGTYQKMLKCWVGLWPMMLVRKYTKTYFDIKLFKGEKQCSKWN